MFGNSTSVSWYLKCMLSLSFISDHFSSCSLLFDDHLDMILIFLYFNNAHVVSFFF